MIKMSISLCSAPMHSRSSACRLDQRQLICEPLISGFRVHALRFEQRVHRFFSFHWQEKISATFHFSKVCVDWIGINGFICMTLCHVQSINAKKSDGVFVAGRYLRDFIGNEMLDRQIGIFAVTHRCASFSSFSEFQSSSKFVEFSAARRKTGVKLKRGNSTTVEMWVSNELTKIAEFQVWNSDSECAPVQKSHPAVFAEIIAFFEKWHPFRWWQIVMPLIVLSGIVEFVNDSALLCHKLRPNRSISGLTNLHINGSDLDSLDDEKCKIYLLHSNRQANGIYTVKKRF